MHKSSTWDILPVLMVAFDDPAYDRFGSWNAFGHAITVVKIAKELQLLLRYVST